MRAGTRDVLRPERPWFCAESRLTSSPETSSPCRSMGANAATSLAGSPDTLVTTEPVAVCTTVTRGSSATRPASPTSAFRPVSAVNSPRTRAPPHALQNQPSLTRQ
jgi:hypothetical protein